MGLESYFVDNVDKDLSVAPAEVTNDLDLFFAGENVPNQRDYFVFGEVAFD
jgi:hypothetical protein